MIKLTFTNDTLIFEREDGSIVVKQLKNEPDLFKRTLYEYLAKLDEQGGGGGSANVAAWAEVGNDEKIPASKIPAVTSPTGQEIISTNPTTGATEVGSSDSSLNLRTDDDGTITVNNDSLVSLLTPYYGEEE